MTFVRDQLELGNSAKDIAGKLLHEVVEERASKDNCTLSIVKLG